MLAASKRIVISSNEEPVSSREPGTSATRVSIEDIGRVIEETMEKVRLIVAKVVERHDGA